MGDCRIAESICTFRTSIKILRHLGLSLSLESLVTLSHPLSVIRRPLSAAHIQVVTLFTALTAKAICAWVLGHARIVLWALLRLCANACVTHGTPCCGCELSRGVLNDSCKRALLDMKPMPIVRFASCHGVRQVGLHRVQLQMPQACYCPDRHALPRTSQHNEY